MWRLLFTTVTAFFFFIIANPAGGWQEQKEQEKEREKPLSDYERIEKSAEQAIAQVDLTPPPEDTVPTAAERQIEFVSAEDPLFLPVFQVDAKVIRQKFVATVTLEGSPEARENILGQLNLSPAEQMFPDPRFELRQQYSNVLALQSFPGGRQFGPEIDRRMAAFAGRNVRGLLETIPEEQRNQLVDESTLDDFQLYFLLKSGDESQVQWYVLGANEEEVRSRVNLLLKIYDTIWSANHEKLWKARQEYRDAIIENIGQFPRLAETYQKIREDWNIVKEFESVSEQSLTDLKTQRQLTDVDLAGIKAKIEVCETLLKEITESSKEVITIKTTAEIELVEKTARRAKLNELIEKAIKRRDIATQFEMAAHGPRGAFNNLQNLREQYARFLRVKEAYAVLPVPKNRVTIHPVEWQDVNQGN